MRIETDLDGAVVAAIERHYNHAKEKHPYFCDMLFRADRHNTDKSAERHLELCRKNLANMTTIGTVDFIDVADCEVAEVFEAFCDGDNAHAIEELYDTIAVFLRAIDVLEGRQALGRPKEGGAE